MNNCKLCNRKFSLTNAKFVTDECFICQKCATFLAGSMYKDKQNIIKELNYEELNVLFDKKLKEFGVINGFDEKKNKECPICDKRLKKFTPTYTTLDNYKVCLEHYELFGHKIGEIPMVPYSLHQVKEKNKKFRR